MEILSLLKTVYSGKDGYTVVTDHQGNVLWQSSKELPKPFCRENYSELLKAGKKGKYFLDYGGDTYTYTLSCVEEYMVIEFSGRSDLCELLTNPLFAEQLMAFDAEKRDAVFKISNSLNEIYDALEKTELYAETDRLNAAGRYCYDIMRINAAVFEMLKLAQNNFNKEKVDIEKAIDEFEWAVSAVIRLTPIRIAITSERELFTETDCRCLNISLICIFKQLIRKYPDCPDFRISAKKIGDRINIAFSTEQATTESPLKSGALRADNLTNLSSVAAEHNLITLFCETFGGNVIEHLTDDGGCIVLSLPVCADSCTSVSLSSAKTDFKEHNRYSPFHIELSELCTVNYF